jgi:DNA-binding MarR family transcriptional regulator
MPVNHRCTAGRTLAVRNGLNVYLHPLKLMNETLIIHQAQTINSLLPVLMRRLSAFDDDPVAELPLAQLRVCSILTEGARPMSALGRELGISLSAVTQIADRLERTGLVRRVAAGNDRRIKHLQLTEQGEKIMYHREEERVNRVRAVLEHLPPEARQNVLASLETLMHACGAMINGQFSAKALA